MNNEFGPIRDPENTSRESTQNPKLPIQLISINKFLEYANFENANKSFRSVIIVRGAYLEAGLITNLERWYQGYPEEIRPKNLYLSKLLTNQTLRALSTKKINKNIMRFVKYEIELHMIGTFH